MKEREREAGVDCRICPTKKGINRDFVDTVTECGKEDTSGNWVNSNETREEIYYDICVTTS